jgi:hypothetical protein
MICLGFIREGRIVQHLDDMKGRQPQVEASCGFKPPMGHKGARLASPLDTDEQAVFLLSNSSFNTLYECIHFLPDYAPASDPI